LSEARNKITSSLDYLATGPDTYVSPKNNSARYANLLNNSSLMQRVLWDNSGVSNDANSITDFINSFENENLA